MSKSRIFQFTWFYQETNDKNQIKWDPNMVKITSGTVLKSSEHEEFIEQQYFSLEIKDLIKMFWKVQVFSFILTKILLISLFLTSDFRRVCWVLHWLLVIVSVRYQNRPCLGREWVIDHQYLRRFRCNNRVLQNNAIYGKRCMLYQSPCSSITFTAIAQRHHRYFELEIMLVQWGKLCQLYWWGHFLLYLNKLWEWILTTRELLATAANKNWTTFD